MPLPGDVQTTRLLAVFPCFGRGVCGGRGKTYDGVSTVFSPFFLLSGDVAGEGGDPRILSRPHLPFRMFFCAMPPPAFAFARTLLKVETPAFLPVFAHASLILHCSSVVPRFFRSAVRRLRFFRILLCKITEKINKFQFLCVQDIRKCKKPLDNAPAMCYNKATRKRTPVRGNPHPGVKRTQPAGRVAF